MWQKLVEHFRTPELRVLVASDHGRILDTLACSTPGNASASGRRDPRVRKTPGIDYDALERAISPNEGGGASCTTESCSRLRSVC
jgi:hypothetical protein